MKTTASISENNIVMEYKLINLLIHGQISVSSSSLVKSK